MSESNPPLRFNEELSAEEIDELLPEEQFVYHIEHESKIGKFRKLIEMYHDIDMNHLIFPVDAKTYDIENGIQRPEHTFLTLICSMKNFPSQYEILDLLIIEGSDKGVAVSDQNTVYHIASEKNDFKMMYLLLKDEIELNLADPEFLNSNNQTPFEISFLKFANSKICGLMILHGTRYNLFSRMNIFLNPNKLPPQSSTFELSIEPQKVDLRIELIHQVSETLEIVNFELLHDLGISYFFKDENKNTILHHVVYSSLKTIQKRSFFETLVKKFGKFPQDFINEENIHGQTVFEQLLFSGNKNSNNNKEKLDFLKYLVKMGSNMYHINSKTGLSVLHKAVIEENEEVLDMLIISKESVKFKISQKDNYGNLALHYLKQPKLYKLLVPDPKKSVDLNIQNIFGNSPILNFLMSSSCSLDLLSLSLSEKKINFKISNKIGRNLFHCISKFGNLEILKIVFEKVSNSVVQTLLSETDKFGKTPLEIAILEKKEELGISYLEKNPSLYILPGMSEKNLVMEAVIRKCSKLLIKMIEFRGKEEELKELINNKKDEYDRTPIHIAVLNNDLESVKVLLDSGICVVDVIEKVNTSTPLMISCQKGYSEIALLILKMKALPNFSDNEGRTALHFSSRNRNIEISKILVENGGIINKKDKDGRTPLYEACITNNDLIVEYLIKEGATIEERDNQGMTPLHVAVGAGSVEATIKLIELGADIKVTDKFGRSPLLISSQMKTPECGKIIIKSSFKKKI